MYERDLRKMGGCKPLSAGVRFEASYIPEPMSGCWLWLGSPKGSNGYGSIAVDGQSYPAHRYSWLIHRGPIGAEQLVLHRCDNPSCVNPEHLFLGDHLANARDKVAKNRQARGVALALAQGKNRTRGEAKYNAKLTYAAVADIRSSGARAIDLASKYGVSPTAVGYVRSGKTWKHTGETDGI